MKVLADLHHYDLYYSLQLLFQKRLGWELYRPIGLDWYHEKFWAVYPALDTAKQFLGINGKPLTIDGKPAEEEFGSSAWVNKDVQEIKNGIFEVKDTSHNNPLDHYGITLEAFKSTKFDIIVSSMPAHFHAFERLIKLYQPQAKHIFQAGNNFGNLPAKNLLSSAKKCRSSYSNANVIYYHQEFDTSIFTPTQCSNPRTLTNFQHYAPYIKQMEALEKHLPNWKFVYHGAGHRDGALDGVTIHEKFKQTGFVWHVKDDEGYGYNIHQSFACGRPMIVNCRTLIGSTAADLFQQNQTVINFDQKNNQQLTNELNKAADNYDNWSTNVYNRFKEIVNFDQEFEQIKIFLSNLR